MTIVHSLQVGREREQIAEAQHQLNGCVDSLDLLNHTERQTADALCAVGDALQSIEASLNKAQASLTDAFLWLQHPEKMTVPQSFTDERANGGADAG